MGWLLQSALGWTGWPNKQSKHKQGRVKVGLGQDSKAGKCMLDKCSKLQCWQQLQLTSYSCKC